MPTITRLGDFIDRSGTYSRRIGLYTGPASYVQGGDSFPPESVNLKSIEHADFSIAWVPGTPGTAPYSVVYDRTNKKVVWFVTTTGAEVAGATNLSTFVADFEIVGK